MNTELPRLQEAMQEQRYRKKSREQTFGNRTTALLPKAISLEREGRKGRKEWEEGREGKRELEERGGKEWTEDMRKGRGKQDINKTLPGTNLSYPPPAPPRAHSKYAGA